MNTCNCMGPQNGEPLCPCRMASVRLAKGISDPIKGPWQSNFSTFTISQCAHCGKYYTDENPCCDARTPVVESKPPMDELTEAVRQLSEVMGHPALEFGDSFYSLEVAVIKEAVRRLGRNND